MNRDLERRLRRLELHHEEGGVRFDVTDEPLSDEEWAAGPPYSVPISGGMREQPMTDEEWEAAYCHDDRTKH